MPALPIVRLGHPSLRVKSKPVRQKELEQPYVQEFIDDLSQTCVESNGAGLAAPQVGVNRRIIIVNIDPENPRYPDKGEFKLSVTVNPQVVTRSKEVDEEWEGDLSANVRAVVPRPRSCTIKGWDRHGNDVSYELEGFPARVFQHEIDHLDGIFLIDIVKRKETVCLLEEWEKYWIGQESFQIPPGASFDIPRRK